MDRLLFALKILLLAVLAAAWAVDWAHSQASEKGKEISTFPPPREIILDRVVQPDKVVKKPPPDFERVVGHPSLGRLEVRARDKSGRLLDLDVEIFFQKEDDSPPPLASTTLANDSPKTFFLAPGTYGIRIREPGRHREITLEDVVLVPGQTTIREVLFP